MPENVMTETNARTFAEGLTEEDAKKRLEGYGENALDAKKKSSFLKKLLLSFADVMTLVLFAAAAVSFAVAKIQRENAADSYIILAIVFLNGAITAFQELKAEKALDELKKLSSPETAVLRNGEKTRIDSRYIVPGDVIFLQKGDSVPADALILESVDLRADESALTGESTAAEKCACENESAAHLAETKGTVWAGTVIVGGSAKAQVISTGMRTRMGKIAEMLINEESPRTPMQIRLAGISAKLGNAALLICFGVFLLSLFRGTPPADAFLGSVSLAVAAIPEGLPAVVTIMLSMGVTEMARRRAVVKKLPAVETLGCATVICSDKTGTLTQNKLAVTETRGDKRMLAELFALSCRGDDKTEKALFAFASDFLGAETAKNMPKAVKILPFDHERRLSGSLHRAKNGYKAVIKGAPEEIMRLTRGGDTRAEGSMAKRGLRVIAAAYAFTNDKNADLLRLSYSYAGCAGMTDALRPEAKAAVKACRTAGIKTVMITGDHPDTAFAAARELGIASDRCEVKTQTEIESLPESGQERAILETPVFARAAPEFKVKIIRAYKNAGGICAMTGDGVNDAPALKSAHIGCAMGQNGTDVAREACDMILTDDDFSTIAAAIQTGRGIYENIRHAVHFLVSCNIGELLAVLGALILALPSPVTAIQLLWVNLVTDSLPAIALGMEKPRRSLMQKPPVKPDSPLFCKSEKLLICLEGIAVGMLTLSALLLGGGNAGGTMAFGVLSFTQLFHSFNVRSDRPLFCSGINLPLAASFAVSAALQLAAMTLPALMRVFGTVPLSAPQWAEVFTLSAFMTAAGECAKLTSFAARKRKKRVAKAGVL